MLVPAGFDTRHGTDITHGMFSLHVKYICMNPIGGLERTSKFNAWKGEVFGRLH